MSAKYIHGFDERERKRLLRQGAILAPVVYAGADFSKGRSILEVGSGVGAQTLELLRRFPKAHITCVELSDSQIATARRVLRAPIAAGRVTLVQASAERIPFDRGSFDGVFVCWVLEHVPNPAKVLKEVRRVLKPGGKLFAREVFNQLWHTFPPSAVLDRHWRNFNERQMELGGDPYIGVKLGALLAGAGFRSIAVEFRTTVADRRDRKHRRIMANYWRDLFLSGDTATAGERKAITREFARIAAAKEGSLFFGFAAASATVG